MNNTMPELNLLSIAGEIAFVLGLLILTLWVLKRFLQRTQSSQLLHTIDTLMISPRQKISLIKVGDRVVMVGISPNSMDALGEWPADLVPDLPETGTTTIAPVTIQSLMARWNKVPK
ncbi:MAG: FliO/MopB family protein [Aequoribacter sp.]|jgi:flagellar protein FliO/FliZ|uniref:FliO/MopB family protein n=1 Tax=Aequoribacter sp. TaxID=2847771 RepID=UPI003C6AD3C6